MKSLSEGGFFALVLGLWSSISAANPSEPYRLGAALSRTSNVALLGQEQIIGVQLAEDYFNRQGGINGAKFQVLIEDAAGEETSAFCA